MRRLIVPKLNNSSPGKIVAVALLLVSCVTAGYLWTSRTNVTFTTPSVDSNAAVETAVTEPSEEATRLSLQSKEDIITAVRQRISHATWYRLRERGSEGDQATQTTTVPVSIHQEG